MLPTLQENSAERQHEAELKIDGFYKFVRGPNRPASDVLLDGLSTAGTVSQSSERGVGLSFGLQMIRQLPGGQVSLLDNDQGTGTLLRMEWEARVHEQKIRVL